MWAVIGLKHRIFDFACWRGIRRREDRLLPQWRLEFDWWRMGGQWHSKQGNLGGLTILGRVWD